MKGLESYFLIENPGDLFESDLESLLVHISYLSTLEISHEPTKVFDLKTIYELTLIDAAISESECRLISKNKYLREIKILNLSCNPFGSKGFQNLLKSG